MLTSSSNMIFNPMGNTDILWEFQYQGIIEIYEQAWILAAVTLSTANCISKPKKDEKLKKKIRDAHYFELRLSNGSIARYDHEFYSNKIYIFFPIISCNVVAFGE